MNESDLLAKGYVKLRDGSWQKPVAKNFEKWNKKTGVPAVELNRKMNERDLHADIFNECRRRGWISFHGSMAASTHRTEGEPDFEILMNDGKFMMVECKTATGKLTPAQQAMIAHASKLGHTIHVVRSFGEFLDLIK